MTLSQAGVAAGTVGTVTAIVAERFAAKRRRIDESCGHGVGRLRHPQIVPEVVHGSFQRGAERKGSKKLDQDTWLKTVLLCRRAQRDHISTNGQQA